MGSVQKTAEHWVAETYETTPDTMHLAHLLDFSTPRNQCDGPCDENTGARIQAKLLDVFLDVVQAKMNAEQSILLKRKDFYFLFECIYDAIEDVNFDRTVAKTSMLTRRLNVPRPPA